MGKVCKKCGIEKDLSEFYNKKNSKDGLQSSCKKCLDLHTKLWIKNNPERSTNIFRKSRNSNNCKVVHNKWREDNPEKVKNYNKKSYVKNREKRLKKNIKYKKDNPNYNKNYYINHKNELKIYQKGWNNRNPEKLKEKKRKRRNLKYNANGSHTEQQWLEKKKYHGDKCFHCKILECELNNKYPDKKGKIILEKMFWKLTEDHLKPLSRGGTDWISNIVPSCWSCNASKNNRNYEKRTK